MNPVITKYQDWLKSRRTEPRRKFTVEELQTAWIATAENKNFMYDLDHNAKVMCNKLMLTKKGVCLCGSPGIGKTLNLDIFGDVLRNVYRKHVEVWEATEIEISFKIEGDELLKRLANCDVLIINEVGFESDVLKDYGTDRNLVTDLLLLRYRVWQNKHKPTYLSTNLSPASLFKRYGTRIEDRMKEMFEFVELTGQSRRK